MSKSTRRKQNAAVLCADTTALEATLARYAPAYQPDFVRHWWEDWEHMAIAGSAQNSMYLELNGRRLFEGPIAARQREASVCDDAAAAWHELAAGKGQCCMRLYGSNLPELREMYASWLEALKLAEVGDE